jgi:hypothetical protein
MKESDRKLQWCPHRRTTLSFDAPGPPAIVETVGGSNAYTPGPIGSPQVEVGTCIGHQCSQWRWDGDDTLLRVSPLASSPKVWVRDPVTGTLRRVVPAILPPGVDATFTWDGLRDFWFKVFAPGDRPGHCGLSGPVGFD